MKIPTHLQEKTKRSKRQVVQKLVPYNFFSSNDITTSSYIIKYIPYYYEYFLPIQTYKNAKISDSNDKFILIITEDTGEIKRFYDLFCEKNDKKIINIYFHGFKTLLLTCQIMIQHQLVHFGISPNTISFVDNRPYLHNFSHSFQLENMTDERKSKIFEKSSSYNIHYPPSYHILNYIIQNNLKEVSAGIVDFVLQEYIGHSIKHGLRFEETDWTYFREYWTKYLLSKKNIDALFQESLNWDIYGLSILYFQILPGLKDSVFLEKFSEFIKKIICNVYRIEDIIECFDRFF